MDKTTILYHTFHGEGIVWFGPLQPFEPAVFSVYVDTLGRIPGECVGNILSCTDSARPHVHFTVSCNRIGTVFL